MQLQEYGPAKPLVLTLASHLGCSKSVAHQMLARAGDRLQSILDLGTAPLEFSGGSVRAVDVAGVMRVAAGVELEIVPKYLDPAAQSWREDLLYISALTRHGDLLASDRIGTKVSQSDDFVTLLARAVIRLYLDARRRPLRTYRAIRREEFALDGDVDSETIILPPSDGYPQVRLELTRQNPANSTILSAVRTLRPALRDPMLVRQLQLIEGWLSPQGSAPRRQPRVPGRARHWRPVVDLSWDILRGASREYGGTHQAAPGFVVDTWRTWEGLIGVALRLRRQPPVQVQRRYRLGTRVVFGADGADKRSRVRVRPDIVLSPATPARALVVDAKYKTNVLKGPIRIAGSDLYEALAFATATSISEVVLVYPQAIADPGEPITPLGAGRKFEEIRVAETLVSGVVVPTSGIGKRGGLRTFAANLHDFLLSGSGPI